MIAGTQAYIASRRKSEAGAFFLALILGPIGSLYGAPLGGAIILLLTLGLIGVGAGPAGLFIGWVVGVIVGTHGASRHNLRVEAEAQMLARNH